MLQEIKHSIQQFLGISLEEMNDVALMKRTDTKFVVPKSLLIPILEGVQNQYKVLEIEGNRVMSYASLYFDTESNKFYNDHHNGRIKRTKIRIRNYIESNLFFLEIKQKDRKGRTIKSRRRITDFETTLSVASLEFIAKTTSKEFQLSPTLWNEFNRITLVNIANHERVTIDFGLSFMQNEVEKKFDDLAIIEVKQERLNRHTAINEQLKAFGHHPYSISKYCIGMISLYNDLKYNVFKQKLIKINKLTAA